MNREIEFFRWFVKKYVPKGERITDAHTSVEAWRKYEEDLKTESNGHRKNEGVFRFARGEKV